MSSLKEICSGLPVQPLPPPQPRDPGVPHAPVRNITKLTGEEKQVPRTLAGTIRLEPATSDSDSLNGPRPVRGEPSRMHAL